jgi:hypothetical protein
LWIFLSEEVEAVKKIIPIGTEVGILLVRQVMDFPWKELPRLRLEPLLDVPDKHNSLVSFEHHS